MAVCGSSGQLSVAATVTSTGPVTVVDYTAGAVANLPVGASVAAYGSVLGMLAAQKGLTWMQLLAMNLSVFAGSAQFVMVEMWAPPLPVVEMILAVLIINMRYLLIGASLHPLFKGKSLAHKAGIMHLVADENWAVTMAAVKSFATSRPTIPAFRTFSRTRTSHSGVG